MRARDLVSLAAAHGVNLIEAANLAAKEQRKTLEVQRKKSKLTGITYDELMPPPVNPANGRETRTFTKPKWTIAEIGHAAAKVPAVHFDAACYSFAGEHAPFWRLHAALLDHAQVLGARYQWPKTVKDPYGLSKEYLPRMSMLVLAEDAYGPLFRLLDGVLYDFVMDVTHRVWENEIQDRYEVLRNDVWLRWLYDAAQEIQAMLSEEEA